MAYIFLFVKRQFLGIPKSLILLVTTTLFIYFSINLVIFDPDFGWHLRMGEHTQKVGVLQKDPFSYTMPSYPFVDPELAGDVLIASLYPKVGFVGLAVICAMLVTFAVALQLQKYKFTLFPFLLGSATLLQFTWVRPQVMTLFFFSVLIFMLFDRRRFKKWRFTLPLIFLLWANIHGGFAIGLLILAIASFADVWERKKDAWITVVIFLLSLFATLVNLYGMRLWGEVWMTISDRELRWSIAEWTPTPFIFTFTMWILIVSACFLVFRYRKLYAKREIAVFLTTLLIGLSGIRHVALFIIVAIPLTSAAIGFLSKEAAKKQFGTMRFKKAYRVFSLIVAVAVILQLFYSFAGAKKLSEDVFYPKGAVLFLREHMPKGEIYSEYGWGGYLIWKLPEKKVFIDGRMAIWKWKAKSDKELDCAFCYYKDIGSGTIPFTDAVARFGIDTVLLPASSPKKNSWMNPLDRWLFEKLPFLKLDRSQPKVILQVKDLGWTEVYKDAAAVIYQKVQ